MICSFQGGIHSLYGMSAIVRRNVLRHKQFKGLSVNSGGFRQAHGALGQLKGLLLSLRALGQLKGTLGQFKAASGLLKAAHRQTRA